MPSTRDVVPLSAGEREDFRARLEEARLFHLERLDGDPASDDIASAMVRRSEAALEAVEAALARIADGTYGLCARCGGSISAERLDAVPHADLCRHCLGAAG